MDAVQESECLFSIWFREKNMPFGWRDITGSVEMFGRSYSVSDIVDAGMALTETIRLYLGTSPEPGRDV